jgi:hypothetical protein
MLDVTPQRSYYKIFIKKILLHVKHFDNNNTIYLDQELQIILIIENRNQLYIFVRLT